MKVNNMYLGNNQYCKKLTGTPEFINSGYIYALDRRERKYMVSRIDYERYDDQNFQYVFTVNWNVVDVLPPSVFQGIPGLNLSLRYQKYYRVNMTPYFITERSPSEYREDVHELLKEVHMDYYDRFEWMLRSNRKSGVDNLVVERVTSPRKIILKKGQNLQQDLQQNDCVVLRDWNDLGESNAQIHHNLSCILFNGVQLWDDSEQRIISDQECSTLMKLLLMKEKLDKTERQFLQKQGIDKAKQSGKYKGRKKQAIDWHLFEQVAADFKNKVISEKEAMEKMNISSRSTFYRRLNELKRTHHG